MRPTIYGRPVSLLRSEFRQSNPVAQSGNLIDVTPVHNESDFLDEELAQLDFRARNGPEPVRFDNTRARLMKQVASRWVLPSDWNDSFLFHCSSFFLFFFARHSLPFDGCVALSARFLSRFFVVVFFLHFGLIFCLDFSRCIDAWNYQLSRKDRSFSWSHA